MFAYRYRIMSPTEHSNERHLIITYDMTPRDIKDDKCPDLAIAELDTIFVMQAPPTSATHNGREAMHGKSAAASAHPTPLPRQDIKIKNGETTIYQSAAVNAEWLKHCEMNLGAIRHHANHLQRTIHECQQQLATQNNTITALETQNQQLRQQLLPLPYGFPNPAPPRRTAGHKPSAFMARLESVREPEEPIPRRGPGDTLRFPSFAGGEHDVPRMDEHEELNFFQRSFARLGEHDPLFAYPGGGQSEEVAATGEVESVDGDEEDGGGDKRGRGNRWEGGGVDF